MSDVVYLDDLVGEAYYWAEQSAWSLEEHDKYIREDAIDECIKALDEYSEFPMTDEYVIIPMTDEYVIKECIRVLGQLKEQKNLTCFDCEHHFMSDCYLECNKHNRINDNKICDDFEQLKE